MPIDNPPTASSGNGVTVSTVQSIILLAITNLVNQSFSQLIDNGNFVTESDIQNIIESLENLSTEDYVLTQVSQAIATITALIDNHNLADNPHPLYATDDELATQINLLTSTDQTNFDLLINAITNAFNAHISDLHPATTSTRSIFEGVSPPSGNSVSNGDKWREIGANGLGKYPWYWNWDASINKWVSDSQFTEVSLNSSGGSTHWIPHTNKLDLIAKSVSGHALFSSAQTSANYWTIRLVRRNFGGTELAGSLVHTWQQIGANTLSGRRPYSAVWNAYLDLSTNAADETSSTRTAMLSLDFARVNSSSGVMTGSCQLEYAYVYI